MYCQVSCPVSIPIILLNMSFKGMDTEPRLIFIIKQIIKTIVRIENERVCVIWLDN